MNKFRLFSNRCSKCYNEFYTTHTDSDIFCPFCGISFSNVYRGRRKYLVKTLEKKHMILSSDFDEISNATIDLSQDDDSIREKRKTH